MSDLKTTTKKENKIYAHLNVLFGIISKNTLLDLRIGSISLEGLQNIFHESTMEAKLQLPLVQLCVVGGFLVERRLDYCCCNIRRKIVVGVLSWRIRNVSDALWNRKKNLQDDCRALPLPHYA